MSDRHKLVLRVYHMISLLENTRNGLTAKEIWEKVTEQGYECEPRTIYRDLEALEQASFPITSHDSESEKGNRVKRWKIEKHTYVAEHFALTCKELLALYLARGVLTPLKDTPFYADLEKVFKKIETRLPEASRSHLDDLGSEMHFGPMPKWGLGLNPDVMETVHAAASEKHVIKTTYASANGQDRRERQLGPHFIYLAKGSVYLVAEDLEDNIVKVWSIVRMSDTKMTDEPYEKAQINPDQYFKSAFGIFAGGVAQKVKLEFSPKIAPYIKERGWHPTQTVVSKEDGTLLFEMEVGLTPEVVQWVLGFGADVKVVEPRALTDKLLQASKAVLEMYQLKKGKVA